LALPRSIGLELLIVSGGRFLVVGAEGRNLSSKLVDLVQEKELLLNEKLPLSIDFPRRGSK
jgi:hypothetical protein